MFFYEVYGLVLQSNCEIPGPAAFSSPDKNKSLVRVCLGKFPEWAAALMNETLKKGPSYKSDFVDSDGEPGIIIFELGEGNYLWVRFNDGTEFIISIKGNEIWSTWPENLTLKDTATYLLGPILGYVLNLRGTICLHASAVSIEGKAVIFTGWAGAGKSTTAAAFARLGYPVISDDIVALLETSGVFQVQPAYPRVRLWPESVEALFGSPTALPRIVPTHPTWDKRFLDLNQPGYKFQSEPISVGSIYILKERAENSEKVEIQGLVGSQAVINLMAHVFSNKFLLKGKLQGQLFSTAARLVNKVSVKEIYPVENPRLIPQICEAVLDDLKAAPLKRT